MSPTDPLQRPDDPSRDVDLTSDQSFPGSDPPPTWSGAGEHGEHLSVPPGHSTSASSLGRRRRLSLVHGLTRRWLVVMALAVALVATCLIGLAVRDDNGTATTVIFVACGLIGALLALLSTVWRAKAGDDLDEARL